MWEDLEHFRFYSKELKKDSYSIIRFLTIKRPLQALLTNTMLSFPRDEDWFVNMANKTSSRKTLTNVIAGHVADGN